MAFEVEVGAFPEALVTKQRVEHANHFGTFVVYGRGVEVVDLHVLVGTDGVCERSRILWELE